ncbi:MAG TPA: hypothetical protein VIH42_11255 [Thermoguttaceae bacterium]
MRFCKAATGTIGHRRAALVGMVGWLVAVLIVPEAALENHYHEAGQWQADFCRI